MDIGYDQIEFIGDKNRREEAIQFIDAILSENGKLGVYGDLSAGLSEILLYSNVRITEKNDKYIVEIYPSTDQYGHDFVFEIDKKSAKLSNPAIGQLEPPPF